MKPLHLILNLMMLSSSFVSCTQPRKQRNGPPPIISSTTEILHVSHTVLICAFFLGPGMGSYASAEDAIFQDVSWSLETV